MSKFGNFFEFKHIIADHQRANNCRVDTYRFVRTQRTSKVYGGGYTDIETVQFARGINLHACQAKPVGTPVQLGERLLACTIAVERKLDMQLEPLGQKLFIHRNSSLALALASLDRATNIFSPFNSFDPFTRKGIIA